MIAAAAAHKGKEVLILSSQRQQQRQRQAATVAASEEDTLTSNHRISLNFDGEGGESNRRSLQPTSTATSGRSGGGPTNSSTSSTTAICEDGYKFGDVTHSWFNRIDPYKIVSDDGDIGIFCIVR